MTSTRTGGAHVVEQLKRHGVQTIFGLHGAHLDAIFQACRTEGVRVIDTRNEMSAGHAAEGYARVSGKLGVVLATAGGGFTNALTSITNAMLDRTPVLYLTSSSPRLSEETNTLQAGFDQVAMAAPVTKWSYRVQMGESIARIVAQAIRIATAEPKGPVLLDIPFDLVMAPVENDDLFGARTMLSPAIADEAADSILALMEAAERPVIMVGGDALHGNARDDLRRLAQATGAPVLSDYSGLGAQSELDPALAAGLANSLVTLPKGAEPDMVLMLGLRFGLHIRHGSGELVPHAATVVQIDPDAREIGRLQPVTVGCVASVGSALAGLAERAAAVNWPDRAAWQEEVGAACKRRVDIVTARAEAEETARLHPLAAGRAVVDRLNPNVTLVGDGALCLHWMTEVLALGRPHAFLPHGYLGSMGSGFGTAIGAAVADAEQGRQTILVTGDGSVGYSIGDFDTLVRHNIPLTVVVMNNRSWGATQHFQEMVVGPDAVIATPLPNGSYHAAAAAFGALGFGVTNGNELADALDRALASNRPACLDVQIDLAPVPPEELVMAGIDPFSEGPGEGATGGNILGVEI